MNLEFGEGISASDISFEYDGVNNVLKIRYSPEPDDVLEMTYGDMVPASVVDNPPVGEMRLADGSLVNIDFAPRVADEDAAFDFQVPANVFGSLGEGFAVSAKLANGQPLPDWLHFDAATRKFSGTPANGDVGSLNVQVLATKDQQATAAYTFALVVKNVNDAPIAGAALEEQVFMEGERWTYDLPADTFTDIDAGDVLTYSAQLADGKPLPDWLQIDPATGRLSTTRGLATRLNLSITATDQQGATAEQLVSLLVKSSMVDQGTNVVVGTSGDDVLVGTAGRDALVGGLGDDSLDGGPGDDELIGGNRVANSNQVSGTGRDTYLFGRGDGRDLISNGRGGADSLDTLKFKAGIKPEDIRVSRENLSIWAGDRFVPSDIRFTIKDTGESIRIPNFHALRGLGGEGVDVVTFEDYPNVVWDAAAIARLSLEGEASTDDIWGYFSDDVLRGNGGNDMLKGQLGNDIYQFGKNDGKDTIVEVANEGSDKIVFDQGIKPSDVVLIKSFDGYPGGILVLRVTTGNTEVRDQNFFLPDQGVELVEFADGTQWDRQYILANLQTSGGSVSNFVGTSGDDRYVVDNRDDSIVEAVNGGTDSVESSVSYALPDNVENLTLTGALSGDLTGNKLKNILVGNDSDNTLDWGGGGLDTLQGGAGNDTYTVLAPLSYEYHWPNLEESRELKVNIIESQNAGIDTLSTNAFYAKLADNLDNLKIVPSQVHTIHSSSQNPVVAKYLGNSLDNVLDASAVQTSILPIELDGQQGNDTLIGSNDDEDRASYRTAAAGVTVSLSIAGAQNTGSAGWDTLKSIEGLVGSAFNDVLTGNGGANVLDGGAGADRLAGGGGNDTYYADHVGDVIVEVAGGGSDTVYVSAIADYTMPDNVEHANVSMGRMPSVTVTGNDSGNSIVLIQGDSNGAQTAVVRGMGGNDTLTATRRGVELDGGGGDDLLIGGGFSGDVFIGGTGNDVYEISSDGGDDVIRANVVAVPAETNALRLKGVTRDKLSMQRQDGDLIIRSSDSQSARIEKFFGNAGTPGEFNPVQVLALDDGSNLDYSAISALVKSNAAPVVNEPMDPREVSDGEWFSWSIPSSAFTDDGGALTYTVALEDGTPLPGWASFDPSSGTISGSVHAGNDQTFRIKITAVDKEGLSASAVFVLAVRVDNKVLEGTANADTLLGGGGADILRGLDGKDQLQGDGGNDRLEGGAGDDSLFGQTGADILIGGLNNDYQSGGAGNDTFEYTKGDGQDTLDAVDVKTATDKLLIHGWLPSQVQLLRSGDHLFARMGSTDQIGFYNYFQAETVQDGAPADAKIDQIVFDNGDIWDQAKIATVLAGGGGNNGGGGTSTGPGNPPPSTYTYAYVLANQYSDYSLSGNAPYVFKGNSKANKLTGNDGANVINGAAGNDTLTGGKGGDTYFLEAGAGQDTIVENDTTLGIVDLLQWGSGIQHDQLWLRKAGNNLEISVIGKTDKAIVKDWYLGDSRHVEQIWANGKVLLDTKVQSLVDAMAAFSPPAAGQTTLPSNYQSALSPVLAANWQ
ncbi:putative Ig domain-containing protein [Acidovorax facilis]|uniref:putative Ig domain-containing protein n=1 Tax=Acidovorax facilis TaxID=12917 RepID=UPI003D654C08